MKISEIRKMPTNELTKKSNELREEIVELKKQVRLGEITNVRIVRSKRKDLSRVLTVLGEELQKETK